jgi:putative transposase
VKILEEARRKYRFVVHGYVVMPEHFHLLITEPEVGDPSVVMKVVKERFSCQVHAKERNDLAGAPREPIWQKRFYDFNVWSARKQIEKLKYIHRNPVKRGLVEGPEQWAWSSFRAYLWGETEPVRVKFQEWVLEVKPRPVQRFGGVESPLIRTERE